MSMRPAMAAAGEEHYRKLERMYLRAPINEFFQPEIAISHGAAEIAVTVSRKFFHAAEAMHGSVYFKCLDDAAFFAVSSLVEDCFVLTSSFNLYLLRPISEGLVRARGKVVHAGGSSFVAEAVLSEAQGKEIARGSGAFVKSKVKLVPEMGYE
ncbi:MAG TPA: PaaI family thioesterase [Candidatus Limnocylindrales bacterium]|nr:PaaI family thioesterase [Candidatus Limnocylindrales bacterium]